jgi:transketolase
MDTIRIKQLKKKIFLTAYSAGVAHLASSFSVIDLLYMMYCKGIVKYDIDDPWKPDRDRVILSKGHACLAQYVVLHEIGMISDQELKSFCKPGSHLGGEPKLGTVKGVEASTGSLGHGLSFGVGVAIGCKMNDYSNRVYVILGDGECQEGSVWEAAMSAVRFGLDNLVVIIDDNRLQAMDTVEEIMGITSWKDKWESFGYEVDEIDGHDLKQIEGTLRKENKSGKPRVVISHTIKGHGLSFMEEVPIWHYRMPNDEEMEIVKKELDISEEELGRK